MATETDLIGVSASPTEPKGNETDLIGVSASRIAAPEGEVIDDPFQLFRASIDTGVQNTGAQINNFNAAVNALMGREDAMQNNLAKANRVTESSSYYLSNMDTFEEFLDEPTFGGFINQAIQATGQFVPSAVASIGLAMTGAGVGVAATSTVARGVSAKALTKAASKSVLPTSIAKEATERKAVQKAVNKYTAIQLAKNQNKPTKLKMTAEEQDLVDNLYAFIRSKRRGTAAKTGALLGAGSQEQVMGTGIAFGDYAEQGMTSAQDAIASFAQGTVFAGIGLGSEVAVAKSVANVVKKKAPPGINTAKDAPIEGIRSRLGKVVATTSVAEGLAEAGQEELSVQQKFRIDEDYTQSMANLDRANALFAGFFGGIGVGTAIGTPSAVVGKTYDQMKQGYLVQAQAEFDDATAAGITLPESEADLRDQFEAMDNPNINKDMVWVVKQNQETMDNLEQEIKDKYPNVQAVEINDVGTLYTTNAEKAQSFADYMASNTLSKTKLDQWLADNLGYTRRGAPSDSVAVRVLSPNGNVVWEQTTTTEGEADALAAADNIVNNTPGYTTDTKPLDEVIQTRKQNMSPMQDEDLQEIENIYDVQEPAPIEEGRGSFLDPITPKQKGKQVWTIPSTDITYDQALVEEARTLVPAEFEREFDENINKKRYSESLLRAFVNENVNDTTGAFYKINENTDRGGFNLIKYNMGYTPGVSTPSTADVTKVINRAKKKCKRQPIHY